MLRELQTKEGFTASAVDTDNYHRVWGRDGVVVGLAALGTGDEELIATFKKTLKTLKKYQDRTGRIPSNVSLDGESVSYGTTVGRIDSTIWFVVGVCEYYFKTEDAKFIAEFKSSIEKALFYLECLELNGRGLLYIPGGGDWADEYINEGYVLFDQALYALAIRHHNKIFKSAEQSEKYRHLLNLIKINYFPHKEYIDSPHVYHKKIYERSCEKYKAPLPLTSFGPFSVVGTHDLFALALILNLPICNEKMRKKMEKEIELGFKEDFPILPAFSPIIDEKHPLWKSLKRNHLYNFKNKPYEFHNGGLWPMVYGFYLASKTKITKKEMLEFSEILKKDDYTFPEFYHGKLHTPLGTPRLGFSAAGFLIAYYAYMNKTKPFNI